jgi:hypothetical protein
MALLRSAWESGGSVTGLWGLARPLIASTLSRPIPLFTCASAGASSGIELKSRPREVDTPPLSPPPPDFSSGTDLSETAPLSWPHIVERGGPTA